MEQNTCILIPLTGMEWNGQVIHFGDDREAVEQILGAPEAVRGTHCYYFKSELRFDFDAEGKLEFIECLGGMDGSFQPEIYGVSAFQIEAAELLELLKQRNDGPVDDSEAGYSYSFLNTSVGVYREITPEDVNGMLREMLNMDLTQIGSIDVEQEKKKAHHWATVGIGKKDYYA